MARIRKLLIRTGIYQAPKGVVRATPERCRHWVDQFRRMTAAGIKVPCAWGHCPDAVPGDEDDRAGQQYYLSRYNAGYLDSLDFDPATGRLELSADIPGAEVDAKGNLVTWAEMPDGRKVKCAVGEVSGAIKDWRDGRGRDWKDAFIHVALTPLPVVAGQDGFRELALSDPRFAAPAPDPRSSSPTDGATYLSLTGLLYELSGDTKDEDPMADEADKPAKEEEAPETPEAEAPPPPPAPPEPEASPHFAEAVRVLQELGLHLPPDTTPANLVERVCVAGHAVNKGREEEEPGEEAPADDDEGVTYSGEKAQEEQRPVMMSLANARDDFQRRWLEKEQKQHLDAQLDLLDRLEKRGMPKAKAGKLRARLAGGYELSMTAELEVVPQPVDVELSIWNEALPKREFTDSYLKNRAKRAARPDQTEKHESPDEIQRRAEGVSAKK